MTKNPIYSSGKLPVSDCPEQNKSIETFQEGENYLRVGAQCLDATWTRFFKKAKLPFRTPSLEFIHKPMKTKGCGLFPSYAWGGVYCSDRQAVVILVDGDMLEFTGTLFLYQVLAHEYGHHIQQRAGITKAAIKRWPKSSKAQLEWSRRLELQADCLAGAYMKSVFASLDRSQSDWEVLLDTVAEETGSSDHGGGKIRSYWANRGFKAGGPSGCNTWSAPRSKVA